MDNLGVLDNTKIGIVGCGHLGQAIASLLLERGLQKQNLLISYGGSPHTYQALVSKGLAECVASNEVILQLSDMIFLTIKPKDISVLSLSSMSNRALFISCISGIPINYLQSIFGQNVCRIMLSGPDTLLNGVGLAALYPQNERLKCLLEAMGLTILAIETENDLNTFTAGVCLPAALVMLGVKTEQKEAIDRISGDYPLMRHFYEWAVKVAPDFDDDEAKRAYIGKMMTKGGETEAIINSLENGAELDAALRAGLDRIAKIFVETGTYLGAM